MKIEVSNGEIADKLTIIELKLERISDPDKLKNLKKEYAILDEAVMSFMKKDDPLYRELYQIKSQFLGIENRKRACPSSTPRAHAAPWHTLFRLLL